MTIGQDKPLLIWGAGAIGGTLAAFLSRSGQDVTVVDISWPHIIAMRSEGLSISGPHAEFTVPVKAFHPSELKGSWPLAVLAVKSQFTEVAARSLAAHLDADGAVLSMQNGLAGDIMAGVMGQERSYTSFVDIAADLLAPGKIRFGFNHQTPIGPVDGCLGTSLEDLVQAFRGFDPNAFGTRNIQAYIWGKNVFSTIPCATAMALSPMADLVLRDDLLPLWQALAGEVIAVSRAVGVEPLGVLPFDPLVFAPEASLGASQAFLSSLAEVCKKGKPHSGMWRDIAVHRRQSEVGAVLTPIYRLGQARGIPCPGLTATVEIISQIEEGCRQQDDGNLMQLLKSVG